MKKVKHQPEFVPSGYPAFTWDVLTPDLLSSLSSSSTEGPNSSIEECWELSWDIGGWECVAF